MPHSEIPGRPEGATSTRRESAAQQTAAEALLPVLFERVKEFEGLDDRGLLIVESASSLAIDDQFAYPLRLASSTQLALGSAIDHLRTIRLVVESGAMPWVALFSMMRSALETAAITIWLLESDDRNVRLLRLMQSEWQEVGDGINMVQNLGFVPNPPRAVREGHVLRAHKQRPEAGTVRDVKRKITITSKITAAQSVVNGMIPRDGRAPGAILGLWQGFSGLTHARGYAMQVILDREELGYDPETGVVNLHVTTGATSLVGCLRVVLDVVDTAVRLFGKRRVHWQSNLQDAEDIARLRAGEDGGL
ncbi:hypothetical protein [Agromyces sp. NPDC055661]